MKMPKALKFIYYFKIFEITLISITLLYFLYSGFYAPLTDWEFRFRSGFFGTIGCDPQNLLSPEVCGFFTALMGFPLITAILALLFVKKKKIVGLWIVLGFDLFLSRGVRAIMPLTLLILSSTKPVYRFMDDRNRYRFSNHWKYSLGLIIVYIILISAFHGVTSFNPPRKTTPTPPLIQSQPLTMPSPIILTNSWNYAVLYCEALNKDQAHLRMLVVKDRETAEQVIVRLKEGESFVNLVMKKSVHPSAEKGGDLGWLEIDDLSDEFQLALNGISAGGYSRIIDLSER